jgi:hypothetical protein
MVFLQIKQKEYHTMINLLLNIIFIFLDNLKQKLPTRVRILTIYFFLQPSHFKEFG